MIANRSLRRRATSTAADSRRLPRPRSRVASAAAAQPVAQAGRCGRSLLRRRAVGQHDQVSRRCCAKAPESRRRSARRRRSQRAPAWVGDLAEACRSGRTRPSPTTAGAASPDRISAARRRRERSPHLSQARRREQGAPLRVCRCVRMPAPDRPGARDRPPVIGRVARPPGADAVRSRCATCRHSAAGDPRPGQELGPDAGQDEDDPREHDEQADVDVVGQSGRQHPEQEHDVTQDPHRAEDAATELAWRVALQDQSTRQADR